MISFANGALIARPLIAREFLGLNVVQSQVVRWRKPKWLGTAKSKMFRVPKRPEIPMEEMVEIQRLFNNYRTYRESVRRYCMDLVKENMVQFDHALLEKEENEDYERCMKLNEEWNKVVGKSREENLEKVLATRKEAALIKMMNFEAREKNLIKKIEDKVRKAKAESSTFITAKNIDEAIEAALANVVSYNVAIDSKGNRYEGKYEPPIKEKRSAKLQAEQ